jgi:septal ring factor EnvC (AmiA/AmiB activator)
MAMFPKFSEQEDPALALLRDELSQTNVKLIQQTEKNAKLRTQLQSDEGSEAQLQVKVSSLKKAIQVLETNAIEAKCKVA